MQCHRRVSCLVLAVLYDVLGFLYFEGKKCREMTVFPPFLIRLDGKSKNINSIYLIYHTIELNNYLDEFDYGN